MTYGQLTYLEGGRARRFRTAAQSSPAGDATKMRCRGGASTCDRAHHLHTKITRTSQSPQNTPHGSAQTLTHPTLAANYGSITHDPMTTDIHERQSGL